jgi:hypothetical protein
MLELYHGTTSVCAQKMPGRWLDFGSMIMPSNFDYNRSSVSREGG